MTDLVEHLAKIQCGCERTDAVADVDRDTLVMTLRAYGFGSGAVPSDWETYYDTDELAEFVLEYTNGECAAA